MTHLEADCSDCGPLDYAIKRSGGPGEEPVWCCPWCGFPVKVQEVKA